MMDPNVPNPIPPPPELPKSKTDHSKTTIGEFFRTNLADIMNLPAVETNYIVSAVRLLETTPLIGKSYVQAPVPKVRRLVVGRSRYHLYWEVEGASFTVTILAVWYAGRGSGPEVQKRNRAGDVADHLALRANARERRP